MDRHTLFSMQAGLLVFLGLVIAVAYRARRRKIPDTSPYWFAAGYILGGVGLGLQSQRGHIPPIYAISIGNALFLLLSPLINKSIAIATKQRSVIWYLLALGAATMVNFTYFTYWQPDLMLRVIEAALVLAVMQLPTVVLLLRCNDKIIQPATRTMAALLIVHITASLGRLAGAWEAKRAEEWLSWASIITIAGLALCFLWIENLRMSSELEMQAMTDPLTGLLNRRALDMFAAREIDMAVRNKWPCSALMLDINHFKETNDRYGHTAGDTALIAVAGVLNSTLRTSDLITRIGGDEFFVLLPNSDETTTAVIVSRIRLAVRALCLHSPGKEPFHVSISIGQTTQRGKNITVAELLHAADIMLYNEKQTSRGDAKAKAPDQRGSGAQVHPSNG
ncbi:MAG: GGDEF domain-containing protein [Acidobacteria bacterium]|nr:GGDEF domain-containing protein [Acidobacteriota bacterium]